MAKRTSGRPGKSFSSSFVNVARRRKQQKLVFIVLTVFLGLGLVGSSFLWLFDRGGTPQQPEAGEVQQEAPLQEQIADLETRLKEDARNTELLGQLAGLYWQAGRGQEALKTYQKALEIKPGDVNMRQDLALKYYLLGNYNDAVQQMEKVLQQDPENAVAYYHLGQFYAYRSDEGRDVGKGIKMLERFIALRKEGLEVERARQLIEDLKAGNAG